MHRNSSNCTTTNKVLGLRLMKILSVIIVISLLYLFFHTSEKKTVITNCSEDWFLLVDKKVDVSDGQGHGPDLGSKEWRSAVEFKLGIRGNPDNPPLNTDDWCVYINDNFL